MSVKAGIDALIIIGGDGILTGAKRFGEGDLEC